MKKNKILEGWEMIKNLKDGTLFRFNEKSEVQWELIKKRSNRPTVLVESQNSNQTREVDKNKLVYLEY